MVKGSVGKSIKYAGRNSDAVVNYYLQSCDHNKKNNCKQKDLCIVYFQRAFIDAFYIKIHYISVYYVLFY